MKLLLDECVPRRLRRDLAEHEFFTIEQAGFKGLKNGVLLRAAAEQFDALITVDKSIPHQQTLATLDLALIILRARSNKYPTLKPLAPQILEALTQIQPGEVVVINPFPRLVN